MKKNKGVLITCSIFAAVFAVFAFAAICCAFDVNFMVKLEHEIITATEWSKFNLLTISLLVCALCALVVILVLVASDDKAKHAQQRQRRQSTMFK